MDANLANGEFVLTPPLERLKEVALFIQSLELENCYLASDHFTNYLWAGSSIIYQGVSGQLPDDKQSMLETVQQAIQYVESSLLPVKDSNQLYREGFISAL